MKKTVLNCLMSNAEKKFARLKERSIKLISPMRVRFYHVCGNREADMNIVLKYRFLCHNLLPTRILEKGEECIKKVTNLTNMIEQWIKICSSRDLFYQIYLCVDITGGGPGGEEEKEEKLKMLKYLDCVYGIKDKYCLSVIHKYIQ
ncbi:hypothetical protein NPIL_596441 [Nephila pilipes]|uniref:Uncharacterized protein n=1 Tax=Nephila pilipes TaxID=299642 RepID=A0A8X6NZX6_NEPPI|nr:hypothetical protein NPIL_596441 [Nephila pilipes]